MTHLTSGLSHHEVIQTAHALKRAQIVRPRFNWKILSALLIGALLALVLIEDVRVIAVLFGLLLTVCIAVRVGIRRNKALEEVIVVRDGLKRSVSADALVPGDLILLPAGAFVPVDVYTTQKVELSVLLRALLRVTKADDRLVPAGARTLEVTEAVVASVGREQLATRFFDDVAAVSHTNVAPVATLVYGVKALLRQVIVLPARTVLRRVRRSIASSEMTNYGQALRRFTQFLRHQAHLWSDALETAFRYHQDPVESPS